jgi:hypothetical protein
VCRKTNDSQARALKVRVRLDIRSFVERDEPPVPVTHWAEEDSPGELLVGDQADGHVGELLDGDEVLRPVGAPLLLTHREPLLAHALRLDPVGADAVHADVVIRRKRGECRSQPGECGLAGGVLGYRVRSEADAGHGRYEQDRPAAEALHRRDAVVGSEHRAVQVEGHARQPVRRLSVGVVR